MGTEGFATYYVRGGGADQNLILLDEAPVYNPNHVFGLFSAFNVDAIKSVTFYKDRFPERYGGRLSGLVTAHKTFLLAEPRLSLQYQGP